MKILEWMQKKLNGSTGKKKSNPASTTCYMMHEPMKQEFSDWPQALLVIGTFGNNNLIEDSHSIVNTPAADSSPSQDSVQEEFTLAAATRNLHNELSMYFGEHVESSWVTDQINQCLDSEGKENETSSDGYNSNVGTPNLNRNSSLIHRLDKSTKAVNGKKSLVFLLKNMFVCRSGFPPTPTFEDTESRILEKILREILHKKLLHPQVSRSAISMNKYQLEDRSHVAESDSEDELTTDADSGSKWDKTDSEYIVLEI